jgi:hypothetical protein
MLSGFSPVRAGLSGLLLAITMFTSNGSAQTVSFSTHTYSNNNLWNMNEGRNGHVRADLNGDGREDFISMNQGGPFNAGCSGSFAVTLSTGDGTYAAPVCYDIPSGVALYFAVGDFNADGTMDVVVTNDVGNAWLFLNNGKGQLAINNELSFPSEAGGIVAADMNHDGKLDLVISLPNPSSSTQKLQVVWGYGDGTFSLGPVTTYTNTEPPSALSVGDFDGDGKADILTLGVSQVVNQIFYGDGAGHLAVTPSFGPQQSYAPADPNSDGTMSVIGVVPASNGNYNVIDIEHGHSNRVLTSQHIQLKSCASGAPVMADFDGDGHNDIIVAEDADCKNNGPFTLNFMRNLNNGTTTPTFAPEQVIYSTPDWLPFYYVMRASHSSKPDLTVWQSQLFQNTINNPEELVLVNTTTGNFPACTPPNFRATGISVCQPSGWVVPSGTVNLSFAGSNMTPGRDMEIWIDGKKVDETFAHSYSYYDFVNASAPLSNGQHEVDVFSVGWDDSLLLYSIPLSVGGNTCTAPAGSLVVCSPMEDGQITSPVTAWAAANLSGPITRMEVWVDGVKEYSTFGSNTLKTQLNLAPGWHQFAYYVVPTNGNIQAVIIESEVK